ncbi:MAG TPA: hypothetical protein VF453_09545 [Burkholderiaceae bacterium]
MTRFRQISALSAASLLSILPGASRADFEDDISDYVGYTIIAVKTIDSFKDNSHERKDGFEGCEYDRVIVFTDGTAVTCRSYGYKYAYRPKAVILGQQMAFQGRAVTILKMVVQGTAYDVASR